MTTNIESTDSITPTPVVSDKQVVEWLLSVGRFYKREKAEAFVADIRTRSRPPAPRAAAPAPIADKPF